MAAGFRRLVADSRTMSRRSFLAMTGWLAFVVATAIALFQSVRFLQPNALYEDPAAFKADPPNSYAVGSTTVLIDKRVVINRDSDGFYAISLICTHLGCTPRYFPDVTSDLIAQGVHGLRATAQTKELPGFKCPCHGSR
ncbi:MAG TPA: Rieske 2Fe-2S domain-containing protein, partial [Candidatus Dormibacteraeota bacterium]|nr:Rieske 2Fe-2S domain-containing protein [Candidatus Dormibacteraeota bacterium]